MYPTYKTLLYFLLFFCCNSNTVHTLSAFQSDPFYSLRYLPTRTQIRFIRYNQIRFIRCDICLHVHRSVLFASIRSVLFAAIFAYTDRSVLFTSIRSVLFAAIFAYTFANPPQGKHLSMSAANLIATSLCACYTLLAREPDQAIQPSVEISR